MQKFVSNSTNDTIELGERLAKTLKGGTVVAFYGGLGMGKTAFTRGMAKALCVKEEVSSPTFAIVNDYGGNPPLYHFDMYRINTEEELYSIGFYDYLGSGAVIAIEWAENVIDYLPKCDISVKIEKTGENERKIILRGDTLK